MRTFMGFNRTNCDCEDCARHCRYVPGYLMQKDIKDIAAFLGETEMDGFLKKYLLASPGALAMRGGRPFRIPTIVPARQENGWCIFFDGKHCNIHPVAPVGCAFFDTHQDREQLAGMVLNMLLQDWVSGLSLYCKSWNYLNDLGLTAPSPEEGRNRMAKETKR
ncbi:MAG: YkgJ family cysteine cluster protein [Syntrophobacteraceae bacterium]